MVLKQWGIAWYHSSGAKYKKIGKRYYCTINVHNTSQRIQFSVPRSLLSSTVEETKKDKGEARVNIPFISL